MTRTDRGYKAAKAPPSGRFEGTETWLHASEEATEAATSPTSISCHLRPLQRKPKEYRRASKRSEAAKRPKGQTLSVRGRAREGHNHNQNHNQNNVARMPST
jgi:hypothetical protein